MSSELMAGVQDFLQASCIRFDFGANPYNVELTKILLKTDAIATLIFLLIPYVSFNTAFQDNNVSRERARHPYIPLTLIERPLRQEP